MSLIIVFTVCFAPILALVLFEVQNRRSRKSDPQGCRKLGTRIQSSLADQYEPVYSEGKSAGKDEHGNPSWRVKGLFTYPIKSCRGVEVYRIDCLKAGLEYDRCFTFAQLGSPFPLKESSTTAEAAAHQWQFLSQRKTRLLALVRTEMWVPDPSSPTYSPNAADVQSGGVLIVTFPYELDGWRRILSKVLGRGGQTEKSFRVPLDPSPELIKRNGYTVEHLKVQSSTPKGMNMSMHVPPELKYFLGITNPMALFRVHADHPREVCHGCAPKEAELGYKPVVNFADSYPMHIIGLATVRTVEAKMNKELMEKKLPPLSVNLMRFRPNILVTGPPADAEDHWKRLRIGDYEFIVACRTTRCKLPTTDPDTGIQHPNQYPQVYLNRNRAIDEGAPGHGCIGMQMIPAAEKGSVRVGDAVEVLEIGKHRMIK